MKHTGDRHTGAYEKGFQWGKSGKPGSGWCHYDSYLEPELVDEWWAGYEAGSLEYLLLGGRRHAD